MFSSRGPKRVLISLEGGEHSHGTPNTDPGETAKLSRFQPRWFSACNAEMSLLLELEDKHMDVS